MVSLNDVLRHYSLRRSVVVFSLAQVVGTGLAIGLANTMPAWVAMPGVGIEILRGLPALLIIGVMGLELAARGVNPMRDLASVFQRITPWDLAAIVIFNLAIGILSILVILLGLQLSAPDTLQQVLADEQPSLAVLLIGAVTSTTLAPLSEEIVFRGWLLNGLRRRMPIWPAIILSSLAFAAIHPSVSSITTALFGVLAAITTIKTRNLWASILLHALNNLMIATQSIGEHLLIQMGLVQAATTPASLLLMLAIPSLVVSITVGRYLLIQKRLLTLTVSF